MQSGRHGKTTVGILAVIREEFEAVKLALSADVRHPRSRYFHAADGHGRFVLGMMADRGNVAAGEATRDLFEYWRPDIVMLVGIAGALSSGDAGLGTSSSPTTSTTGTSARSPRPAMPSGSPHTISRP